MYIYFDLFLAFCKFQVMRSYEYREELQKKKFKFQFNETNRPRNFNVFFERSIKGKASEESIQKNLFIIFVVFLKLGTQSDVVKFLSFTSHRSMNNHLNGFKYSFYLFCPVP